MGTITIKRYSNELKDCWNSFVGQAKNGLFMFDRNYMDYHSDRFQDHSLIFYDDDEIVALLPANERNHELFSHGGLTYGGLLLGTSVKQHTVIECFQELVNYAASNGINAIIYKPIPHVFHLQPAEEDLYALSLLSAQLREISASTVLNLKSPLKMPKGRKAQISRARREDVEVHILEQESDYKRFIELENEVLEMHHGVHAVHTADELYLLHTRFPDNIHLYGALKDEKLIAGTVIFEYENAIHTQYMASNDLGRSIGALDLTISTVINDYRDHKQWLDFGISTEDHGKYLNEGLISQKEGFGGRTNIYMAWRLDVNQSKN